MRACWDRLSADALTRRLGTAQRISIAAVLFGCGVIALFAALYRDSAHGGPLLWIGLALLAATVVCWFAAARAEKASG